MAPAPPPRDSASDDRSDGDARIRGFSAMSALLTWLTVTLHRHEDGQGMAEYALILALIGVIAIAALVFLGTRIGTILSSIRDQRSPAAGSPPGTTASGIRGGLGRVDSRADRGPHRSACSRDGRLHARPLRSSAHPSYQW